jgi:hypothetical protein
MRLSLKKNLSLVHSIASAQRNHHLQTNIYLISNSLTKKSILCLLRSGLILHYYPKNPTPPKGSVLAPFCFILRYWEGQPLTTIGATPAFRCSYQSLKRRFKHGSGVTFLVWSNGRLLTSDECLEQNLGGLICVTMVA